MDIQDIINGIAKISIGSIFSIIAICLFYTELYNIYGLRLINLFNHHYWSFIFLAFIFLFIAKCRDRKIFKSFEKNSRIYSNEFSFKKDESGINYDNFTCTLILTNKEDFFWFLYKICIIRFFTHNVILEYDNNFLKVEYSLVEKESLECNSSPTQIPITSLINKSNSTNIDLSIGIKKLYNKNDTIINVKRRINTKYEIINSLCNFSCFIFNKTYNIKISIPN